MSMLPKVEIFAGLSEEEQAALENSCVTRNYPRNTVVINATTTAPSATPIIIARTQVHDDECCGCSTASVSELLNLIKGDDSAGRIYCPVREGHAETRLARACCLEICNRAK